MRFRPKIGKCFQYTTQITERRKIAHTEILEVPMKHGDMMVMVGAEIQKFFEVSYERPEALARRSNNTSTLSSPTEAGVFPSLRGTSTLRR